MSIFADFCVQINCRKYTLIRDPRVSRYLTPIVDDLQQNSEFHVRPKSLDFTAPDLPDHYDQGKYRYHKMRNCLVHLYHCTWELASKHLSKLSISLKASSESCHILYMNKMMGFLCQGPPAGNFVTLENKQPTACERNYTVSIKYWIVFLKIVMDENKATSLYAFWSRISVTYVNSINEIDFRVSMFNFSTMKSPTKG